jgi:hypothetical protein
MLPSIRSVIWSTWAMRGYQRSMVEWSSTFPSSTSCSRIVTVNVFVMLPIGAACMALIRLLVAVSATPRAVALRVRFHANLVAFSAKPSVDLSLQVIEMLARPLQLEIIGPHARTLQ